MKTAFVANGLVLLASLGCSNDNATSPDSSNARGPNSVTPPVSLDGPLAISLDNEGRFAEGWGWKLDIESDLSANLEIRTFPEATTRAFNLENAQIEELRAVLVEERFFELNDEYGELVADGSTQTITVRCGSASKTVRLHYLMNWVHGNPSKLVDPSRAVRVWMLVRGWFNDEDAVDLERYDQMVVDAVAKL